MRINLKYKVKFNIKYQVKFNIKTDAQYETKLNTKPFPSYIHNSNYDVIYMFVDSQF